MGAREGDQRMSSRFQDKLRASKCEVKFISCLKTPAKRGSRQREKDFARNVEAVLDCLTAVCMQTEGSTVLRMEG